MGGANHPLFGCTGLACFGAPEGGRPGFPGLPDAMSLGGRGKHMAELVSKRPPTGDERNRYILRQFF